MHLGHGPTTLSDYLAVLRRRKWIIIITIAFALVAALVVSQAQSASYRATSKVVLDRANIAPAITRVTDPSTLGNDPNRFLTTQAGLARSPVLARRVVRAAGVPGITASTFLADSKVAAASNADILNMSVARPDDAEAIKLTNSYAREFTAFKADFDTAKVNQAIRGLRARMRRLASQGVSPRSTAYATLLENETNLETVGRLLASNAQVLKEADQAEQISPRTRRNVLLGVVFGAVIGLGLAILAEALDRGVRREEEIEEALDLPVLARIPPPPRNLRRANRLVMVAEPNGVEAAAFRKLRANLDFVNHKRRARTIMLTSSIPREGKSTTAANLAVALARGGRHVALVDFDLRKPFLHEFFRVRRDPGVTDVVLGDVPLREAMRN